MKAQELADALAGNIRVWIGNESFTQAHTRNVLEKAGIPVIWERGPIRVRTGTIMMTLSPRDGVYEVLWEPTSCTVHGHRIGDTLDQPYKPVKPTSFALDSMS